MATTNTPHFTATVSGLPRIGPNRELKRAVEGYWAGRVDADALAETARALRAEQYAQLRAAGLDSVPVGTFSYYDQMLDTAAMLGALPARVANIDDELDRYFAAARGADTVQPLEMTKWFDTNYHYLVPEIAPDTSFSLHPDKLLAELAEAARLDVPARPVAIGPITFLKLSKAVSGQSDPMDRLAELVPLYERLLEELAAAGAPWVQIEEPVLVTDLSEGDLDAVKATYTRLAAAQRRPAILVSTYFGSLGPALPALASTGIDGIAVDLTADGAADEVAGTPALREMLVVAGVVDGRNVWRSDPDAALAALATLLGSCGAVAVGTSCSLLHVPYSLAAEPDLDPDLRSWLAFGAEKLAEVRMLATALAEGPAAV
ncbi:MAG: 5-methyltetrahydropteroyltriglutamate--homocysteine S-methyltransferase, partial [Mycobacteriaceae bacterium]|nr:5-methyltetrahydropteroyltriglutamate--homocysteine S-methyltransferase [Mycobacteriaceae bacterium]